MPELQLVETMTLNPASCLLCGCAPVDETLEDHPPLPAVMAVGMDVNWGDQVYICMICCGVIADLIDRPSAEKVQKVISQAKFQKKRADKAEQKLTTKTEQLEKIVAGSRAVKQVKRDVRAEA